MTTLTRSKTDSTRKPSTTLLTSHVQNFSPHLSRIYSQIPSGQGLHFTSPTISNKLTNPPKLSSTTKRPKSLALTSLKNYPNCSHKPYLRPLKTKMCPWKNKRTEIAFVRFKSAWINVGTTTHPKLDPLYKDFWTPIFKMHKISLTRKSARFKEMRVSY